MTSQSGSSPSGFVRIVRIVFRWISQLLKTIWTFFPSLLFIFLPIVCFWMQGDGKDILVAFTEQHPPHNALFRFFFFLAVGFWVYVTWYSSRMIAYAKENWQKERLKRVGEKHIYGAAASDFAKKAFDDGNEYFEIGKKFLDVYPRLAGNACFLVVELAIWQLPVFPWRFGSANAGWLTWVVFFIGLGVFFMVDRWINKRLERSGGGSSLERRITRLFWWMLIPFLAILVLAGFLFTDPAVYIFILPGMLFLMHIVYLLYINLRRRWVSASLGKPVDAKTFFGRVMDYFCIPGNENNYLKWFLVFGAAGLIAYIVAIYRLDFSRRLGPFPLLILAFAVILGLANIITIFSVRYRVNFHVLILAAALIIGTAETHYVKKVAMTGSNRYKERPGLPQYLKAWLRRVPPGATPEKPYDIYFVLSNGGASRSGYWTASILGRLEDTTLHSDYGRFSDHIFCLSGTSGGGVGVATYFSMLKDRRSPMKGSYMKSARDFLCQDYFSYTVARMLGPDYLRYIFHFFSKGDRDRGRALEESLEESARNMDTSDHPTPFYANFSEFRALDDSQRVALPLLFINTTRMQDGNPGVVTNMLQDSGKFNKRIDVLALLPSDADISLASGAILGARFPYLSPAGNLADNNYFVDGGYFDNSGAGVVQETIQYILDIAKADTSVQAQLNRVRFHVLHIVNSPVGPDSVQFHPTGADSISFQSVAPIKNDLLSPILTIVGTYGMQTTVNDIRLYTFIEEANKNKVVQADVQRISLYRELKEWMPAPHNMLVDTEAAYPMNWFMSNRTETRMDQRLDSQPYLKDLIRGIVLPAKKPGD